MLPKLIEYSDRAWKLSGLKTDPLNFAIMSAIPAALLGFCAALAYCFAGFWYLSLEVFGFVFLCVLALILSGLCGYIAYHQYKLANQLPNTLEIIVSLLKSGLPISEALIEVSQTCPMPIKGEFERVVAAMREGVPAPQAIDCMTPYVMVPQLIELRDAMRVSMSSGGQLAQRVETIAKELRDKDKERQIMQKSLSTFILLPPVAAVLLIGSLTTLAFAPAAGAPFFESASTKITLLLIFAAPVIAIWKQDKIKGLALTVQNTQLGAKGEKFITREKLKNELSKFIDLVLQPLEAGMTFPAAVQKARQESASSFPTLNRELDRVMQEQTSYTNSLPDAFRNIGTEYGVGELQALAASVEASSRHGASMGNQLREQSLALRSQLATDRQSRAASIFSVAVVIGIVLFAISSLLSLVFH
ncbi:MAG TPA: type II secretion system F family protein [Planktothrix sp.]|jgi:Flp pilus assembly protein TadB